jgi:hypothetical protein
MAFSLPALAATGPSPYLRLEFSKAPPSLAALSVDSLGKGKLDRNLLRVPSDLSGWKIDVAKRFLCLRSTSSQPLTLDFDPIICHVTLLGRVNEDGSVRLPALLHLPDYGTFRITSNSQRPLGYSTSRGKPGYYVRITFPAEPNAEYKLEVTAIYPGSPSLARDPRFDGFRRNFLNIYQINPKTRTLANHAASDVCAFTVFKYSEMAVLTPPLAGGLTALDLLRDTLDRYLGGMKGYGMVGYLSHTGINYLDSYPSLLIAADNYMRGADDKAWLARNYAGLKAWGAVIISQDKDGDGLIEYPVSGNSIPWPGPDGRSPANWWDTIAFGHKDAYSNALAYRAWTGLASLARRAGQPEDARDYEARAARLKAVYYDTFYNPKTGVLAGWKSADGQLHDYYFTFVQGLAVTYGLLSRPQANAVMDRTLAKMKEVGYTRFELGLPGNLVAIPPPDYVHHEVRWGGGSKPDGSDGFQIYENGGATACYAYFTLKALYDLGRAAEADAMLFPMLGAFEAGAFQGRAENKLTYDWKDWEGRPHGYEGLLVDGYLTLLATLSSPEYQHINGKSRRTK